MKTVLTISIIVAFYVVTLAGLNALFGSLVAIPYMLFGAPFSVVIVDDALQNYSFFKDEV